MKLGNLMVLHMFLQGYFFTALWSIHIVCLCTKCSSVSIDSVVCKACLCSCPETGRITSFDLCTKDCDRTFGVKGGILYLVVLPLVWKDQRIVLLPWLCLGRFSGTLCMFSSTLPCSAVSPVATKMFCWSKAVLLIQAVPAWSTGE